MAAGLSVWAASASQQWELAGSSLRCRLNLISPGSTFWSWPTIYIPIFRTDIAQITEAAARSPISLLSAISGHGQPITPHRGRSAGPASQRTGGTRLAWSSWTSNHEFCWEATCILRWEYLFRVLTHIILTCVQQLYKCPTRGRHGSIETGRYTARHSAGRPHRL